MKSLLTTLIFLAFFSTCQSDNKKIIEGDLYFKIIDLQRFYDAPDSILVRIETSVKNANKDTLTEQDKNIYDLLKFMVDKELLRKPFIRLRKDDGKIIMVFLVSTDYEKIKDYNHNNLIRENKKIRVRAEVSEIKYDSLTVYETIKPISIDKIDGKTYWKK